MSVLECIRPTVRIVTPFALVVACVAPDEPPEGVGGDGGAMPTAVYVRTDTDSGFPVDVIELHIPDGVWYEASGFGIDELLAERQNLVAGEWVDREQFLLCGFGLESHMLPPESSIEVRRNRSHYTEDPPEVRLTRVGVQLRRLGTEATFICWTAPFLLEGRSSQDGAQPSSR